MRVTDKMIFGSATAKANAARERLNQATDEISSGIAVNHPGDDPLAAGLVMAHRKSEARFKSVIEITSRASNELATVDGAIDQFTNLLTRCKELAQQFGDNTTTATDKRIAANEVRALFSQAIALLNTQVNGRYVFGGNRDSTPPFDSAGNYLGDDAVRQIQTAPGVMLDISVRADVFAKGAGGGVDALATVSQLADDLANDNLAGIQGAQTTLLDSISQAASGRTAAGTAMSILDASTLAARAAKDAETKAAADQVDADAVKSASDLALAQRALDATLSASAQSFKLTLLDKM